MTRLSREANMVVIGLRRMAVAGFVVLAAAMGPALAQNADTRLSGIKKPLAQLQAMPNSGKVVVKFREGRKIRMRAGQITGLTAAESRSLAAVLRAAGVSDGDVRRMHARSEAALDAERPAAERESGRGLADLNLYYVIQLPLGGNAAEVASRLNALGVVEFAEPAPVPSPLPRVDIPPVTPNMTGEQGYKSAAPAGVGVLSARYPGADGAGIEIVDVEYSWRFNHEDLELPANRNIDTGATLSDPFNDTNHGTAVLGEIVGKSNAYGVTGIVPAAKAFVAPANTVEFGFNPARAIGIATGRLDDGDVILIEQQAPACGGACGANQVGCGPQEAIQSVFDAISTATAKGIVVVEAAGNGNVNLDAPACGNLFNPNVRDSRAIIVGAGTSTAPHTKLAFSSFGSRVNVQAWGQNVTTTGYGDRFNPGDIRQRYTSTFGGTSGASPIVTGVVASIQGFRLRCGKAFLTPLQMRTNLVNNGTPQGPGAAHIGPLPRILQSIIASGAGRCIVGPGPS